ncbi:hypothetical protein C8R42DRAFT_684188 [Lentinula raphanica]|nr:hypothetical protein C8R42DRAFT_684188 [Lentinula raphanica]
MEPSRSFKARMSPESIRLLFHASLRTEAKSTLDTEGLQIVNAEEQLHGPKQYRETLYPKFDSILEKDQTPDEIADADDEQCEDDRVKDPEGVAHLSGRIDDIPAEPDTCAGPGAPNLFKHAHDFTINGGDFNAITGDMHLKTNIDRSNNLNLFFRKCVFKRCRLNDHTKMTPDGEVNSRDSANETRDGAATTEQYQSTAKSTHRSNKKRRWTITRFTHEIIHHVVQHVHYLPMIVYYPVYWMMYWVPQPQCFTSGPT